VVVVPASERQHAGGKALLDRHGGCTSAAAEAVQEPCTAAGTAGAAGTADVSTVGAAVGAAGPGSDT
jgi:hypothetical protein